MGELMSKHKGFTALVAGNDLLALGCYDYLAQESLSCPDDVSVVGFNDIQFVDKVRPGLTTIALPQYEIGATASKLLLERIREPHLPPREIVLPVTLVVRGSTAPPPRRSTGRRRGAPRRE
jgi:LacI family transcriptional regulator